MPGGWTTGRGGKKIRSQPGGGGAAEPEVEASPQGERKPPRLPNGVQVQDSEGSRSYSFDAEDKTITMRIKNGNVDFDIDGDYNLSNLGRSASNRVAINLLRIMEYDAAGRPDGFKYRTDAWDGDRAVATRVTAYTSIGFSRPINGQMGSKQFATVVNGRLTPDNASLQRYDTLPPNRIAANMRAIARRRDRERDLRTRGR